jgi:ATP-dependent exoDNAse (exonuclease V) beta subunit
MEFARVFIVGLTENEWEKGRQSAKIPSPVDMAKSADDAARQFYVALTRARDCVTLSYARETMEGRERKPSAFIMEGAKEIEVPANPLPLLHSEVDAPQLVRELTKAYLTGEGLSPSALADYLESPPTFFARRVLHLREPEQARMLIGTSVHVGIAAYLETGDEGRAEASLGSALSRSLLPRNKAYDQACDDARARLQSFLAEAAPLGKATAVEKTYRHQRTVGEETANLNGKVDAVLERDGVLRIIDFKTSTSVKAEDSKFALQLAFYDYLIRENGEHPQGASIIQVRADGIDEVLIPLTDETRTSFLKELDEAIGEMLSGKWRPAEVQSPYDDLLKLFG